MSLPPEQSRRKETSAGRYEFRWGASPDASISKRTIKHNYATTTISLALISIVVVLGSALLVVSYYKMNLFRFFCHFLRGKYYLCFCR